MDFSLTLWVAIGGALGAATRFGIGEGVRAWTAWPGWIAVLVANTLGTAILGLLLSTPWFAPASLAPTSWQALAAIGFCGALTTFSAFGLDTILLWHERRRGLAALNVAISLALAAAVLEFVARGLGSIS